MRSRCIGPLTAVVLVGLGAPLVACQGPHEIRYETQHLRIGTDFDEPLCRGDLDRFDLVVTNAESVLATTLTKPIEVYLWSEIDWDSQAYCHGDHELGGCYRVGVVYSNLRSADHEIVHGVIDTLGEPAAFWEEATAEALSDRTRFGAKAPAPSLDVDRSELSYGTAGAFARWLLETHGPELYGELLRHSGGARTAFESVYGMTAEDAQAEYFETSYYSYGKMVACEHAELEQVGPREWTEEIEIDCDVEHVFGGPFGGMRASRVLEITERGYYSLSTSAETVTIGRCQDADLESPPILDDPAVGDIPFMTPAFPEFRQIFHGDEGPASVELAPGRYEISLSQSGYEGHTYAVSVVVDPGPVPQTPESTP